MRVESYFGAQTSNSSKHRAPEVLGRYTEAFRQKRRAGGYVVVRLASLALRCAAVALPVLLIVKAGSADGTRGPANLSFASRPAASPNVVEVAPWLDACGSGCENAYVAFAHSYSGNGMPVSETELARRLVAADAAPPARPLGLDAEALRSGIIRELNIGFMLDGLDRRELAVAVLHESRRASSVRRKLMFWDPISGSFEATLFLPDGPGPHPAVLGLHGHRHNDARFAREFFGEQLADEGFAVLIPRLRALDCSRNENRIAHELLRRGFTLMGLHVYEALLMVKYLDSLGPVDGSRIGVLGHSGGSSLANVLVRVSDRFTGVVVDHQVDFRDRCGPHGLHCETVPGMFPLSADVNDRSTLAIPWLKLPYKYPTEEDRRAVMDFFDRYLRRPAA